MQAAPSRAKRVGSTDRPPIDCRPPGTVALGAALSRGTGRRYDNPRPAPRRTIADPPIDRPESERPGGFPVLVYLGRGPDHQGVRHADDCIVPTGIVELAEHVAHRADPGP